MTTFQRILSGIRISDQRFEEEPPQQYVSLKAKKAVYVKEMGARRKLI